MYFAHLLPPTRLAAIMDERVAEWELAVAQIEACCALDDARASPGMRFAAGYGRAVIGAALAYVRANKAGLVQEVAGTVDPSAWRWRPTENVPQSSQPIAVARTSPEAPAGRVVD